MADNEIRTAVVLGGTGWVGRSLCAALTGHGVRVVAVARTHSVGLRCHRFVSLDLSTAPAATTAALLREESADLVVNATDAANATDGWERTEAELAQANMALVERVVRAVRTQPQLGAAGAHRHDARVRTRRVRQVDRRVDAVRA